MAVTRDHRRRIACLALLGVLAAATVAAPALAAAAVRRSLSGPAAGGAGKDELVALLTDRNELYLEARPLPGEGLLAFARRLCGSGDAAAAIVRANGGAEQLLAGVRYRVPYDALRSEMQLRVVRALFDGDRGDPAGWRHRVRGADPLGRGSLWQVAEWFTGDGANFRAIREENGLVEDDLEAGQEVVIPARLLRPVFRAAAASADPQATRAAPAAIQVAAQVAAQVPEAVPAAAPASPGIEEGSAPYRLEYGQDAKGEYAIYRLQPGEALYSSVVVRFTGALYAADVNSLAAEIAKRSGIADVTDIPVGYPVKVPFELMLPEYLPPGDPRREEYEASLRESGRFTNRVRTRDLAGITVILDAGHGGVDVGASFAGVWESLYVYDIKARIERLLELHTAARVVSTTRDGDHHRIPERDVLPFSRDHVVLTHPPYPISNSTIGVNLRWYLANSVYAKAIDGDGDPQKVIFLSIHADSLHPSLRGAMAYIPAASKRKGTFRKTGGPYRERREWREQPAVSFSWKQRVESEGLSRQFAEDVIGALARRQVAVHPYKPVREKIVRNRSEYVPAVLRYNEVPAKVLLEVCNLANPEDRKLLQTRAYRETVAEAVVEAILRYYGQGETFDDGETVVAAAK